MRGYGIVSATSLVVGEYTEGLDGKYGEVQYNTAWWGKRHGKPGRDVFNDRAACVAAVDKKIVKKRASLRKQLAELEALTGEAVVAAAETKAKGGTNGEA